MSPQQRIEIGKIIAYTGIYYGRELEREVLKMMVDDLDDLLFDHVFKAYVQYRRDPKNKTMPLPAQIRDLVSPTPQPEVQGREIASRIQAAIKRFGWPNGDAARTFIGEIGWEIVRSYGGWAQLCHDQDKYGLGTFQAQIRERAKDLVAHGTARINVDVLPEMPGRLQISESMDRDDFMRSENERKIQTLLQELSK